ncbi:MAG: OmpA family protein [Bacteroidetes bacterium]|nr:OmpA family protein [Bacteroidota bacterium]
MSNLVKYINLQIVVYIFSLSLAFTSCSSHKYVEITTNPISDCDAAVPIITTGRHKFNFIGNDGKVNDLQAYPSLSKVEEDNSVWFTFVAPYDGNFKIKVHSEKEPIQMIVFQTDQKRDLCSDIRSGRAEIKRLLIDKKVTQLELRDTIAENIQFPLQLKTNEVIMFVIMSKGKKQSLVTLDVELTPLVTEEIIGTGIHVQKIIDQRIHETEACIEIKVRDIETLLPIIAFLEVKGVKGANGNYKASDLFLVQKHTANMELRCFAQGYFFIERTESIFNGEVNIVNLWMEPISRGKAMVLEDIQFMPGTSDFTPTSSSKLKRLKDFMVLNPKLKIEVQGHVMETGTTTSAGQLLSEARAKKVVQYLMDAGIDKNRMKAVGFGGTKPIFAEPKTSYQEQANRRVEIRIL